MKITEDSVPRCETAEQGLSEEAALKKVLAEKSKEFEEKGAEIYAKGRKAMIDLKP